MRTLCTQFLTLQTVIRWFKELEDKHSVTQKCIFYQYLNCVKFYNHLHKICKIHNQANFLRCGCHVKFDHKNNRHKICINYKCIILQDLQPRTSELQVSSTNATTLKIPLSFLIYLFVCLFIYLFGYLFIYLCLFIRLFICLFICLFIYLFIYLFISLFIYLLTCLFIYLFAVYFTNIFQ
jgi:hypothetical protein